MLTRHHILPASLALLLFAGAACAAQPASSVTKTLTSSPSIAAGSEVEVHNLLGHVSVRSGATFKVTAKVVAGGKNQAAAQALADSIHLVLKHEHGETEVHVHYPVDRYQSYQYVGTGSDDSHAIHFLGFTFHPDSSSSTNTQYQDQRVAVYRGRDKGVPLHVDLIVSMPAGSHVKVDNAVGAMQASAIDGKLSLESDSGDIAVKQIKGSLKAESDAGDIKVANVQGKLDIDTDAGDVKLDHIKGDTQVKSDAGDIIATALTGGTITLDSDAGDIHVDGASGSLHASSDAGDLRLANLDAVTTLHASSDAGDIHASGNLASLIHFKLETDAGDITVATAQPPAVQLDIQGQDISVKWPAVHNIDASQHRFRGAVGTAVGSGTIRTDAGDITLTQ